MAETPVAAVAIRFDSICFLYCLHAGNIFSRMLWKIIILKKMKNLKKKTKSLLRLNDKNVHNPDNLVNNGVVSVT
jgi:hypothetical protein